MDEPIIPPNPQKVDAHASESSALHSIAPLWHTTLVLVLLLGISLVSVLGAREAMHRAASPVAARFGHLPSYAVTLVYEWILLAIVLWGTRLRGVPLRRLLGVRRPGVREFWMDIAIGLGFWFGSLFVLGTAGALLRVARLHPEDVRGIVSKLAPASAPELLAWVLLSVTAGICEELIFRGYLQQQFSGLARNTGMGIAIAAVIFGAAHLYEGVSGALLIALFGVLFGLLAHYRRSLRAGMFAHAWHDSISGFALYFAAHGLHRLPH